jgi:phenylpyruvate tautomerase PptA (4-oxalocrotonate tautomerase family)
MPLIVVNTSLSLRKDQKDRLKSEIGKAISIIPTKAEKGLMVDISDGHTIYFSGEEMARAAHVDLRLFTPSAFEAKAEFTRTLFGILHDVAGLKPDEIYVTIGEFNTWGTGGDLKE